MRYDIWVETKLKKFFKQEKGLVALYLFGSVAKKSKRVPEDIDLAILFERQHVPDFRKVMETKESLCGLLKKDVDLIVLNRANPILKHQIFREGKLLINKNASLLNDFFSQSLTEYEDIKRVRKPIEQAILKGRVYGK